MIAFLLPSEAAVRLGTSERTIRRRVAYGEIPALVVSERIVRVLDPASRIEALDLPLVLSLRQVAELLRIHRLHARKLAASGDLPARRHPNGWAVSGRQLRSWLAERMAS